VDVAEIREAVRATGLLQDAGRVVAMISGGRDSVCLLDVAVDALGHDSVSALHVNYGLREGAGADELHCTELCAQLGVELAVLHADRDLASGDDARTSEDPTPGVESPTAQSTPPTGNLQAWARDVRYDAARAFAQRRAAALATGHTASDQLETILYRLAASPGRRALLGMQACDGGLIRPLLGVTREQTTAYCEERGLRWREDSSNDDERFARARVRHGLVPALRAVHPAAEANVLRTAQLLREESAWLEALVDAELGDARAIAIARLAALPRPLARMVVMRLAELAAGTYVPRAGERVDELVALGARGRRAELHLGGFACAVIDDGALSMRRLAPHETSERRSPPPGEG
jgi:tRNA(Ile)-lysidine synthase